ELSEALVDGQPGPYEPGRSAFLDVLLRIWNEDRTVGSGVPWERLQALGPKIAISRVLVQSLRNEELLISIEPFQIFAERATNTALAITDQLDAIQLLGLSDVARRVDFLRSLAATPSQLPARRLYAIEALGYICSDSAAKALDGLRAELTDLNG